MVMSIYFDYWIDLIMNLPRFSIFVFKILSWFHVVSNNTSIFSIPASPLVIKSSNTECYVEAKKLAMPIARIWLENSTYWVLIYVYPAYF